MSLAGRRERNRNVYTEVYRDFPSYRNRKIRIDLTREWIATFPRAKTLLDVGCGRGEVVDEALTLGLEAFGVDIVPELADHPRVDIIDGADKLPFVDDAFDLVTCTDVVEHIQQIDVENVLRELARVAKTAVLITACHRPDTPGKYGPHTLHVTVQPRGWWENRIKAYMGAEPEALYLDRVNENGTWFEVRLS